MAQIKDTLKITGALRITLTGPDGVVKEEREIPNLVVAVGKNFIASRMIGTSDAVMSHMAVGAGINPPVTSETALETELGRVSIGAANRVNNAVTYVAVFPAGTGTGPVTEAGIFNSGAEGTMLCRTVFAVINKNVADTLGFAWTVTVN